MLHIKLLGNISQPITSACVKCIFAEEYFEIHEVLELNRVNSDLKKHTV